MRRPPVIRRGIAVALVAVFIGVHPASADSVSDQQRKVTQIADQLQALQDRIGNLDEQHGAALDRMDALTGEIAIAQAAVDAKKAALSVVEAQMTAIAIDKFTSGGSTGLAPVFSSPQVFTDDLQRSELSKVALNQGAGTSDEMQALISDLADATTKLEKKKVEQAKIATGLATRQKQGEELSKQYAQQYAAAQAELGDLIQAEQQRRAEAAAAAELAAQQAAVRAGQNQRPPTNPGRGGGVTPPSTGGNTGGDTGGDTGGNSGGDTGGNSGGDTPDPSPPPPSNDPPPSSTAGLAIAAARSQLGVPYVFAAESPGVAFDCSGLTKYAWGRAGVSLPHQASQQYASLPHVSKGDVQPGDLIFYRMPIGHVAIYIGGGMMIHAPQSGDVVRMGGVNWASVVGVARPG